MMNKLLTEISCFASTEIMDGSLVYFSQVVLPKMVSFKNENLVGSRKVSKLVFQFIGKNHVWK